MIISPRAPTFQIPSYSLTGDVLAYQRCGLQYRYYNGSALPPSRPVQMWTGEFVHGVLEEAYRYWCQQDIAFPWPCNPTPWEERRGVAPQRSSYDLGEIGDAIESRLTASGKQPRSRDTRSIAYKRVDAAVNLLGPHLFPLITAAEQRLSGTRVLPSSTGVWRGGADRYELTGIVDVISKLSLIDQHRNQLVKLLEAAIHNMPLNSDLIVDYKAERRPGKVDRRWNNQA